MLLLLKSNYSAKEPHKIDFSSSFMQSSDKDR